jgi:hypothetical protein
MTRERTAQILLIVSGLVYGLVAVTMLAAPEWFFQNIGHHPPYNRHYVGDLGAFQLGLAAGLIAAAWNPTRNRVLTGAAAIAGIVHPESATITPAKNPGDCRTVGSAFILVFVALCRQGANPWARWSLHRW